MWLECVDVDDEMLQLWSDLHDCFLADDLVDCSCWRLPTLVDIPDALLSGVGDVLFVSQDHPEDECNVECNPEWDEISRFHAESFQKHHLGRHNQMHIDSTLDVLLWQF